MASLVSRFNCSRFLAVRLLIIPGILIPSIQSDGIERSDPPGAVMYTGGRSAFCPCWICDMLRMCHPLWCWICRTYAGVINDLDVFVTAVILPLTKLLLLKRLFKQAYLSPLETDVRLIDLILTSHCSATRGLLATDHVILNHGQVTWTTPELAPPLLTTTPHQREDVSALDRFNVHRCPTRRVFSGTGLELVTRQATVRYLYHLATAATKKSSRRSVIE
ncbi:uncharacterized protein TNCV_1194351 [Trichonephila clavipes]|nr:uncharacterized protein TNCV_1194351 [Trichonephila clavipes]